LDGRRQRRALTAAHRSIELLALGDAAGARRAATTAAELDQVDAYADLTTVVEAAAAELEASGSLSPSGLHALRDAMPPGPLAAAAEALLGDR
jgi:hypothetical protein